jgi:DNA-binding transcriptional LysR family regulator
VNPAQLHNFAIQLFTNEYLSWPFAMIKIPSRDFDWSLARTFLAALESGSLLGAAKRLGSSQPTVGRQISELESQLGVALFERTGRGLVPTASALQLAVSAQAMEAAALQLARSGSGSQKQVGGMVRITASQPVACYLLPPILSDMRRALPEIQVELESSNVVSNLLRREADIAVRMVRPDQATLVAKKIGAVKVGIYASRDYLARRGTPKQPMDLIGHDMIGYDKGEDIIRGFRAAGQTISREAFAFRTDDLIVQWQAARAGLGIGFFATYLARTDPNVLTLLPAMALPELPMWLTVHREIRTSQRIRAAFDFLAAALPRVI